MQVKKVNHAAVVATVVAVVAVAVVRKVQSSLVLLT
jgi:hypothetical protein